MNIKPQLSIITVNLNNAEGLKNTIESVFNQTFTSTEFIIIDGGSTDGSLAIIEKYKNKFDFWISEPDTGVFQAMNKGIRKANGEYLLFLNSGDFLVDEKVLKSVFSTPHSEDYLLGKCNISDKGKVTSTINPPYRLTFGDLYTGGIAHQASFIKKEVFSKYGLYDETFRYGGHDEFCIRTIILKRCSTKSISTIISDYNMDGISSKEFHTQAFKMEKIRIRSHPFLQLFTPDYDEWIAEKKELKILFWIKSKRSLYILIKLVYKFATLINRLKKK